jgi:hypothetical protein
LVELLYQHFGFARIGLTGCEHAHRSAKETHATEVDGLEQQTLSVDGRGEERWDTPLPKRLHQGGRQLRAFELVELEATAQEVHASLLPLQELG